MTLSARSAALGQFFTPAWACELLLRRAFPNIAPGDVVLDPACGDGRFLMAVPETIEAFGIEIDPAVADEARTNSGRPVVTGDFVLATLPQRPTHIIGNPPYKASTIEGFLARCYELLDYDRQAAFLLPVYFFQTAGTVVRLGRCWSIAQELVPRNLFQGLMKPLCFATFTKARQCSLSGFFLYSEVDAINSLRAEFRAMFIGNRSRPGVWHEAVHVALRICGGRATLQQLYQCLESRRPTDNPFWREKIRQVAGQHFTRIQAGEYAIEEAA